jgi:hypothetical protein
MKLLTSICILICFLGISFSTLAQHIKIDKDRLAFLKKEKIIPVVFDYTGYKREGKKISEADYLIEKTERLAAKDKDTKAWLEAYYNHKNNIWQEAYVHTFNEKLAKYEAPHFTLDTLSQTAYTMKVKVLWIYAGYDFGVGRSPAKISLKIQLIDNATNRIKAAFDISESRGGNSDDDNDFAWRNLRRVENAFSSSAYKLAIALKRVFDKK